MKQLIIIGASGHGKVVADIAEKNGYDPIVFLDDNTELTSCGRYPVVGKSDDFSKHEGDVFVAIGSASVRSLMLQKLEEAGRTVPVLLHPGAIVAEDVFIGIGTAAAAGAIINPGAVIGKGCILNTASSVDHDCVLGDYVHVAVGAHLAGNVTVGERTWVGAGAVISNNIDVCGDCMIGAGAVVVGDMKESGTYVGVPAKLRK